MHIIISKQGCLKSALLNEKQENGQGPGNTELPGHKTGLMQTRNTKSARTSEFLIKFLACPKKG